jgi:hypothetical protein
MENENTRHSAKTSLPDLLEVLSDKERVTALEFERVVLAGKLPGGGDGEEVGGEELHLHEHPKRHALRFLRADGFDVAKALQRQTFCSEVAKKSSNFAFFYRQNEFDRVRSLISAAVAFLISATVYICIYTLYIYIYI